MLDWFCCVALANLHQQYTRKLLLLTSIHFPGAQFVQHGVEFVTEHVLPLLTPLLTAQQLNVQQFAKYMLFVKDVLRYYCVVPCMCF